LTIKGSVDTLRHFSQVIAQAQSRRRQTQLIDDMLRALARDLLPERPHRIEPRHQKRRPKAYPFLTKPRAQLKAKLLKTNKPRNQGP
jgi:hypothetical protein